MTFSKTVRFALAAMTAGIALPVSAQVAATQVSPGMQVYDMQNDHVGVVSKLAGGKVYVQTDRYVIPLEATSVTAGKGKALISLDRTHLNSFYETDILPAQHSLEVGKPVKGTNGAVLGTIKEINDAKVVLALPSGQLIELPRNGVAGSAEGATAGITADDLAKQLGANAPAPAPAADAPAAAGTTAN
jgi:hypothetical protein